MKSFVRFAVLTAVAVAAAVCFGTETAARSAPKMIELKTPKRPARQTDVLGLRHAPMETVRVGFIGVGHRGRGAVNRYTKLEGVRIVAICDLQQSWIDTNLANIRKAKLPDPAVYTGKDDWKKVCERDDIDLIYICTDWLNHTPMAVYAMERGKHVAIEVPAAVTIDECWQLVNTAEKTRRHCMMLENCCYDFFEMTTLNMAQQGRFGEIVHVEGAYIHDARESMFGTKRYWDQWRLKYNTDHTGNPYPTHGLGPVCQVLDIHRGDRMEYLVSVSSGQFGLTAYAQKAFGKESPEAQRAYALGDMNTTVIRTAKGKTIMVQHDITSPRPYSRLHTISGTSGFAQKYPMPCMAFDPAADKFLTDEQLKDTLAKYEHPLTREIGEQARKVGGHGGMDFIMDYRLVWCLRNGQPLDQDVYDAAEWSCLVPLTELSARNGGATVAIPDFTRGAWNKLNGFRMAGYERPGK